MDRIQFFGILLVAMLTFILGYDMGERREHEKLHVKYVKMCPTKAIAHTVSGDHICYVNATTVRKIDE